MLDSLSVGGVQNAGWTIFTGKATYALPNQDPVGSHSFTVYVEDNGEPGRADRFWVSVTDKNRTEVLGLSLAAPATQYAEDLFGGDIQVPQGARRSRSLQPTLRTRRPAKMPGWDSA